MVNKWNVAGKWNSFVSLNWYDGLIEFIFRFVAKTSEPLLAAGLVISAADFLSKGALMRSNPDLTYAWAWTQAIAIEASSGVVFVYALQSFRQRDKVKAWIYLILSILLAITGGAMLMFQLIANTTGLQETSLPPVLFYSLAGLRVLVSISYVYLCRAKHIRFTDLADETRETSTSIKEETMQQVLANLAEFERWKQQLASGDVPLLSQGETTETEDETSALQAQLERLVSAAPEITVRDAAVILSKPPSTVGRHLARVKQMRQEVN
jgi:DNA-binding transcriptional ArsR family regulator